MAVCKCCQFTPFSSDSHCRLTFAQWSLAVPICISRSTSQPQRGVLCLSQAQAFLSGAPLGIHGDDWLGFPSSWAVFLPSLSCSFTSATFSGCLSFLFWGYLVLWYSVTQEGETTWCFVVRNHTMCSPHLRLVGFHTSPFPLYGKWYCTQSSCIIANGPFISTQFKPLCHFLCKAGTGWGQNYYLNRIQVW